MAPLVAMHTTDEFCEQEQKKDLEQLYHNMQATRYMQLLTSGYSGLFGLLCGIIASVKLKGKVAIPGFIGTSINVNEIRNWYYRHKASDLDLKKSWYSGTFHWKKEKKEYLRRSRLYTAYLLMLTQKLKLRTTQS